MVTPTSAASERQHKPDSGARTLVGGVLLTCATTFAAWGLELKMPSRPSNNSGAVARNRDGSEDNPHINIKHSGNCWHLFAAIGFPLAC